MKNIRLYILFALLILAGGLKMQAQEYDSYFGIDSTRLNMYMLCIDYDPTIYLVINCADTVQINGQKYLQGFPQGSFANFFYYEEFYFREDTGTGRLYRYFPMHDEEEVLLCDMSLEVGDSFNVSDQWGTHTVVVESVSFENERKVIVFENTYEDGLAFYEGVFPSYYPIGFMDYWGCDSYLLCEYKDGEQVFENPQYGTCFIYQTSVQEQDQQIVSLYPNPAKGEVLIECIEPIEVKVYNALGQLVIESKENVIDLSVQRAGIYILKVITPSGVVTRQIVKK